MEVVGRIEQIWRGQQWLMDAMIDSFMTNGKGVFCWVLVWVTTGEYMISGKRRPMGNVSRQEQNLLRAVLCFVLHAIFLYRKLFSGFHTPCTLAHLCTLRSFSSIDNTTGAALARHLFFDDRDLLAAHTVDDSSLRHVRRIKNSSTNICVVVATVCGRTGQALREHLLKVVAFRLDVDCSADRLQRVTKV